MAELYLAIQVVMMPRAANPLGSLEVLVGINSVGPTTLNGKAVG